MKPTDAAFPRVVTDRDCDPPIIYSAGGLTKRELFAAIAMQGILSGPGKWAGHEHRAASYAVIQADALIAQLGQDDV